MDFSPHVMACPSLFLFSSCGSLLCALTPFIPNASLFWALQYPMLDSPKPPRTSSVPPQSHSHDTDTHYTVHTRTRRYSLHSHFILLYHSLITRRLDLRSILYFPFVPFVFP